MRGDEVPEVRFAAARGARIAYQDFGAGPPVVVVPPFAQDIELAWERHEIRSMLHRMSAFCRLIPFDKRGTGSSDRRSLVPGLDERVDDLGAVLDAAGIDRAHLYAQSEGGPMAILFAATYPDRVDSLILHGAWARYPGTLHGVDRDELLAGVDGFVARWGTPDSPIADGFAPSLSGDASFRTWHQRYERRAATSDALADLLRLMVDFDVRDVLDRITAPTLVLHRAGDQIVPIELGRELAAGIPGARLVEQEGVDHFAYAGDIEPWVAELERFVTGEVRTRPVDARPARPTVVVRTLGRFAVEVDGEEVPTSAWGSRRARTLLKRLVVARGWPVTRDELTELLWPDDTEVHRLGARLSVQLSAVRRVLGGGVVADRETVRLDLSTVTTDLEQLHGHDDGAVLDAYAGELLPEDRYDDWTQGPRDLARARFTEAARRRLSELDRAGDHLGAVELARRFLEAAPLDDDAHRTLVTALLRSERPDDARRALERWNEVAVELGMDVPDIDELA
ncbi:MAG: alpha/beta fold hydrolase [Actinomycetota bacterium]